MTAFVTSLHPSPESLAALVNNVPNDTAVTMLNLLRFREFSSYKPGATDAGATGQTGRERVWVCDAYCSVIAPTGESWDEVLLVQYPNKGAFLKMIQSPEYLAIVHHRTAALADSRLVETVASR